MVHPGKLAVHVGITSSNPVRRGLSPGVMALHLVIKPTAEDIGRKVIYRERGTHPGRKVEEGVLTSYNDSCAFVRYGGVSSAATSFEDLEWP